MQSFKAFRVHDEQGGIRAGLETIRLEDLSEGEIIIEAAYSGINYKDALAVTGKGKILRRFPLVAGIDVSGTVVSSTVGEFREGDEVLVAGAGLGEKYDGGFAEYTRVKSECVVPLPPGLTLLEAMILGTPGLTAALALHRLEENHQRPALGPIAITGASGGVGNLAVDLFSSRGYDVTAITGKTTQEARLKKLGARQIMQHSEIPMGTRPLESALWGGAVDCIGGETLSWLTRTVREWGNIASIGQAGGYELNTTVMPLILRGVSMLGISSTNCPPELCREIWQRLGSDLKPKNLECIHSETVALEDLLSVSEAMIARKTEGRTVVKIK
ncbi:MAG: YhdH/YhfP family quinone oxidoreductase [Acidobacteriota bacterium]